MLAKWVRTLPKENKFCHRRCVCVGRQCLKGIPLPSGKGNFAKLPIKMRLRFLFVMVLEEPSFVFPYQRFPSGAEGTAPNSTLSRERLLPAHVVALMIKCILFAFPFTFIRFLSCQFDNCSTFFFALGAQP